MTEHVPSALEVLFRERRPDLPTEWGDDLILGSFLRPHLRGLHPYLYESDLPRGVSLPAALPEGARVLQQVTRQQSTHVVAEVGDLLLCLRSWSAWADCWVSGPDAESARLLRDQVVASVPRQRDPLKVQLSFWSAGRNGHAMQQSRALSAPTWLEVCDNYPPAVQDAMQRLIALKPDGEGGGRLLLWHGPPGTGKTTAVRALLREWRDWARGDYITDPERLFNDSGYLNRVVLEAGDEDDERGRTSPPKWRVVIIEDAEEFLRRDARALSGQALGRLLNVSDGMLGQGLRTLILLTSNEELGDLHPALIRPGRCLARMEFGRLSLEQSATIAGRPVAHPLTLAEALESKGSLSKLEVSASREAVGLYL